MSQIEDSVAKKIQERAEVGKNKYGVTMERTDLNNIEWLIHAQEEAMDLAVYLERIIQDMKNDKTEKSQAWLIEQYNRNKEHDEMVHTWDEYLKAIKQMNNG
tara:strand:+ start:185 stop:490 length:306 start_codon:yes stop_codon:yes gene_type:complete